jgi:hypothetical protein
MNARPELRDFSPWQPGRLWSLWDMLELKAGAFVHTATDLARTAAFISGINNPSENQKAIFKSDTVLDEADRKYLRSRLVDLPVHLDALGADVTSLTVADADARIGLAWTTWGAIERAFEDICSTLKRELSLKTVLVLQPQDTLYFAPKNPLFGADFASKFTTAGIFELDEAAKCLSLGRPTAAVFHLMRILEIGIKALADCLGIPDPVRPAERNWGFILKSIKENGLDKKWPKASDRLGGDGLLFEGLHASLDAIKNPWRNETMHVASKYTDDEAKHIFVAVEGFMKKLAARMDEKGLPSA